MTNHIRLTECTIQRHNGSFCAGPSAEGMPFPICSKHAIKLYKAVRDKMDTAQIDGPIGQHIFAEVEAARVARVTHDRLARRSPVNETVYYLRVGDHIKIGFTTQLRVRLRQYPRTATLLAAEPGDITLERRRHREFAADLAAGNEWFNASEALLAHVAAVARSHPLAAVA